MEDKNLVKLLSIYIREFKDAPTILARILLDNNFLRKDFKDKIENSNLLNIQLENEQNNDNNIIRPSYFTGFNYLWDYYESLLQSTNRKKKKNILFTEGLTNDYEISRDLDDAVTNENYELAAIIRDKMIEKNIRYMNKKINFI